MFLSGAKNYRTAPDALTVHDEGPRKKLMKGLMKHIRSDPM